jgi:hypothetical protein
MSTTHLHVAPISRMRQVSPSRPQYATKRVALAEKRLLSITNPLLHSHGNLSFILWQLDSHLIQIK